MPGLCLCSETLKKRPQRVPPWWFTPLISQTRVGFSWAMYLMLALAEAIFVYSRAFSNSSEQCLVGAWMKYFTKEKSKQEEFRSPGALCLCAKPFPPWWRCLHSLSVQSNLPATMNFSVWAAVRTWFTCIGCCGPPQSSTSSGCFWGLLRQPFLGHLKTW